MTEERRKYRKKTYLLGRWEGVGSLREKKEEREERRGEKDCIPGKFGFHKTYTEKDVYGNKFIYQRSLEVVGKGNPKNHHPGKKEKNQLLAG